MEMSRRQILAGSGVALIGSIAGCLGGDDATGSDGNGGDTPTDEETDGNNSGNQEVADYLSEVANYDGIDDRTDEGSVTVRNGAVDGAGQPFVFDPAAIRVSTGTDVTWEWVDSNSHSVTAEDETFDSSLISGEGETWAYTFDEPGTYLYYCIAHRALEQKGAVVVE